MKRLLVLSPLVLLLAACGGGDPAASLAAAREAQRVEDYPTMRAKALEVLDHHAEDPAALALLARAQLMLGDGDGAQATLQRWRAAGGSGAEITRMLAEAALLRGLPRKTLDYLGKDGSPDAWRLRAAAHIAQDEAPAALDAFRKGLAAGDDYQLARDYARFMMTAQDDAGTREALDRVRRLGPDRLDTLLLQGQFAQRQGRMVEARAAYVAAAKRYTARVEPLLALAQGADLAGNLDEAIGWINRAEKIAPTDTRVVSLVVQLASEKGDWERVRKIMAPNEGTLDPRSPDGLSYAEALLNLNHPEQARAIFAQALLLSPQNPYSRLMLAQAQLATGDAATALRTIRPLSDSVMAGRRELTLALHAAQAAEDPSAAALAARLNAPQLERIQQLSNAGQSALIRRDWAAALAAYRSLPGFDNDPEVLRRLAQAATGLGRHDEAIGYADRALTFAPRNPDMLHMAGLTRLNAGRDHDQAVRFIEQASELDPANPLFHADLARAMHAPG
ncbi:tetratricopeptide repeat protein [Novosphingobium sp.]|uniref:tetratricopeptide repeat protein n=1 Tax=Novosphingobium sp. TaxID=1874826 RepID=UPI0038BC9568